MPERGPDPVDSIHDLSELAVHTLEAIHQLENKSGGHGAARDRLIKHVTAEHDAQPADIEDAIEEALLSGFCYEPTSERLRVATPELFPLDSSE